ncbi:hypothetical protein RIF29_37032 [Crotalaria pallida]|uniref:DNA-directed RNA polymerase n=1 Tax=Crotalaria pallida TaxID=3830 RepID=A0AAN9HUN8_CROPI
MNVAANHETYSSIQLVQQYIASYFDNDLYGLESPILSICSRLKGKAGRIRSNLMGKRGNFSARTIITHDPMLTLDEIGIPWSIALDLTYPEYVTPYNIERLKELVEYGPNPPPGKAGAKHIIRDDGERLDLRYADMKHLEPGYKALFTVERHLIDGDIVLSNHEPSLHKMSTMGHRIKVMPHSTFRFNPAVASLYNADFDRDEMNMHVPQSIQSRTEVLELMMASKCVLSPQSDRPVMGIDRDSLLACILITKRDTFITKDVFMNIMMWLEDFDWKVPIPAILKPEPLWTGKQVFNLIIPKVVSIVRYSSWHSESEMGSITPGDTMVRIEKGELLSGTLCKNTLGTSTGSLIYFICKMVGPDAAAKFLSNTQRLANYWLLQNAFSIGIDDTIVDASTMSVINQTTSHAKENVKQLMIDDWGKKLEAEPGQTMESFEKRVCQTLDQARDDAGNSVHRSSSKLNNLKAIVTAGSKGSFINMSKMTACVGQQKVEGKRIPYGFIDRTLPHFTKYDYGPESHGFVENSYVSGLTPQEFFFHAMGGRDELIDTELKLCETRYIQRRLVKAMEDIVVTYDGTVRNSMGDVVQFVYGEPELRLDPGEIVGCVAAQSIGGALNNFRSADVTLGVPRLQEIINVAKRINSPVISVYMKPEVGKTKEKAQSSQCDLQHTTLRSVTQATQVWYDPNPMNTIIEEDADLVKSYYEVHDEGVAVENLSPWLLRIELNREKMVDSNLSVAYIAEKIKDSNLSVAYIDENIEGLYPKLTCISNDENAEKPILLVRHASIVGYDLKADVLNLRDDLINIREDCVPDNIDRVFSMKLQTKLLPEITLRGIPNITKVSIRSTEVQKFDESEGCKLIEEWILDTEGADLRAVLCHEVIVDAKRTTTNNFVEVREVLGIEAARKVLLDELRAAVSFNGYNVDYRHLTVLCDIMTCRGDLMPITRHGINRKDTGPLMRCSFEETVATLLNAARYAETDHVMGVSESIMLGQLAPIGTAMSSSLYLKEDSETVLPSMDLDCLDSKTPLRQDLLMPPGHDPTSSTFIASTSPPAHPDLPISPTYNYVGSYSPSYPTSFTSPSPRYPPFR